MKAGGGNRKGGAFERRISKWLSGQVSKGKREDIFWRSSQSGGRATMQHKRGVVNQTQQGDISGIDPLAELVLKWVTIECKHVRSLNIQHGMLSRGGPLYRFWGQALRDATRVGKEPLLIALENRSEAIVMTTRVGMVRLGIQCRPVSRFYEWRKTPFVFRLADVRFNFNDDNLLSRHSFD